MTTDEYLEKYHVQHATTKPADDSNTKRLITVWNFDVKKSCAHSRLMEHHSEQKILGFFNESLVCSSSLPEIESGLDYISANNRMTHSTAYKVSFTKLLRQNNRFCNKCIQNLNEPYIVQHMIFTTGQSADSRSCESSSVGGKTCTTLRCSIM
jgi:hypothetical protein